MKIATKYLCFFIFLLFSGKINAQKIESPINLSASDELYVNRIVLTWKHSQSNYRYRIFRTNPDKKVIELGIVEQPVFDDRNALKSGVKYEYQVSAIAPNGVESGKSNMDLGSIPPVATGTGGGLLSPEPLSKCFTITVYEHTASAQNFSVGFSATSKCNKTKSVQLSLYRSDDEKLDATDNLLSQQSFDLSRTRGALTSKNNGTPTTGFLILKASSKDDSFIVVRKM